MIPAAGNLDLLQSRAERVPILSDTLLEIADQILRSVFFIIARNHFAQIGLSELVQNKGHGTFKHLTTPKSKPFGAHVTAQPGNIDVNSVTAWTREIPLPRLDDFLCHFLDKGLELKIILQLLKKPSDRVSSPLPRWRFHQHGALMDTRSRFQDDGFAMIQVIPGKIQERVDRHRLPGAHQKPSAEKF